MKYIQRIARGCCCSPSQSIAEELKQKLIQLVTDKLNEIVVNPNNSLSMEEASRIISSKFDELLAIDDVDEDNIATDSDISDLFGG